MTALTAAGMPWGKQDTELEAAIKAVLPLAIKLGMGEPEVREMFQGMKDAGMSSTQDMAGVINKTLKELVDLEDQIGLNKN
jgi:hypothetical protein